MTKAQLIRITFGALALAAGGCASGPEGLRQTSTSPTATPPYPVNAVPGAARVKKSIGAWVACDGVSDQAVGVARAFAAAKHEAFELVVDCPVRIHSGLDVGRVIYIDDGTRVSFTGAGKFTVDNILHPAFVIANANNVAMIDWNVEYDASVPVNPDTGGYGNNGQWIAAPGKYQPAGRWNDVGMTPWLAANRAIVFGAGTGSMWFGPTNSCAVFFISGDTSNVNVTGMRLYVPANAGGDRFIPMAFSMTANYKSNQSITKTTPVTSQYVAIPHGMIFSNITLDGTYMGWQGSSQDVHYDHIRSLRYGDLQDADGQNGGGVGKWFAPPHLFYISSPHPEDPLLGNKGIVISDVTDNGPRVGVARDKGGADTISGYALSIKIGCNACSVSSYSTTRPDGFLDVLPSDGLTVSNVTATYDSKFLNDAFPGWRFPASGYRNITFENITLNDSAAISVQPPISKATAESNEHIVFKNVRVQVNRWAGGGSVVPNIVGHGNEISLEYAVLADASRITSLQKGTMSLTLTASPAAVEVGGSTMLTWTSKDTSTCSAVGAWSGALATGGARTVQLGAAGSYDFTLNCQNASESSSKTVHVVVR